MAQISEEFKQKCSHGPAALVGALVDSMPYPLIVRDMDYRVVLANRAAEREFARDLIGCKCHDIEGLKHCVCADCPACEATRIAGPVDREVRDPRTGKQLVVSVFPMLDAEGSTCGVIETVRDVTQERRSMDKIRSLLAQVTTQNRELSDWQRSFAYELKTAREIQRMLVPARPLCIARTCFDFLYRPSGEIGGDLYDICPAGPEQVGLLVCDASGHGVAAALIATMVKIVFRAADLDRRSPVQVMKALNGRLVDMSPAAHFVTAFYSVYDSEEHVLRYASCGHPAPLLLRAAEEGVTELAGGGMVLGSLDDVKIDVQAVTVEPGDKLLVYTDGVTDCVNRAGERFGIDRLRQAAAEARAERGPEFLKAMSRRVDEFGGGARQPDDVTMVVAEHVDDEPGEEQWLRSYPGS